MKEIEQAAQMSVGRACGLAGFGIILAVLSLSFDPVLAARSGAILTFILMTALLICAAMAGRSRHERAEVWLMVDRRMRPPARHAQKLVNDARRYAMLWFAAWSALSSALFAAAAIVLAAAEAL